MEPSATTAEHGPGEPLRPLTLQFVTYTSDKASRPDRESQAIVRAHVSREQHRQRRHGNPFRNTLPGTLFIPSEFEPTERASKRSTKSKRSNPSSASSGTPQSASISPTQSSPKESCTTRTTDRTVPSRRTADHTSQRVFRVQPIPCIATEKHQEFVRQCQGTPRSPYRFI
jgi:hypothetical protein